MTDERKAEIRQLANKLYSKHYQVGKPAEKMISIIKREGIWYFENAYNKDLCGMIVSTQNYPTQIYINSTEKNKGRKNFTTAHELGHYALGHVSEGKNLACSKDEVFAEDNNEIEREASYFANCFLLPRDKISNHFTSWFNFNFPNKDKTFLFTTGKDRNWNIICGKIKNYFAVNSTAVKIALVELGLINNFHTQ